MYASNFGDNRPVIDMNFSEPVTAVTDYALGAASCYFGFSLLRAAPGKSIPVRLWSIGFFALALAAFAGGTYHALRAAADAALLRSMWNITMFSIGATGAFMVAGVMASSIRKKDESRKWLLGGMWMTLAGFVVQQSGVRLHMHFNHNDIFHIVQIGALYLFFRGASLLDDARTRQH
jgi:hypothetical protein